MNRNSFVIDTGEGCESFVLVTPDLVLRAWLESQEPDVLGGHVHTVSYAGGRALDARGCGDDAADFTWCGSRSDLVAIATAYNADYILSDRRFQFTDQRLQAETPKGETVHPHQMR